MKGSYLLLAVLPCMAALAVSVPARTSAAGAAAMSCGTRTACDENSAAAKVRKPKSKKQAAPAAPKDAKKPIERTPYTEQDREAAVIPGLTGCVSGPTRLAPSRTRCRASRVLAHPVERRLLGAYGAGVLVGLSQSGKRPDYAVVTGVSIGAVMAPYAFLGQRHDDKLRDSFLTLTSADVFEDAVRPDSLVDTWPLKDQLAKRVTPELLADIAAEHNKGRRLFVVTADLDSERAVIWNLGAIAAQGGEGPRGEAALKRFRQVLPAASAIPGIFPPVYIDAEAQGKQFQEMHADGAVFVPSCAARPRWLIEPASRKSPVTRFDVILHSKLVRNSTSPARKRFLFSAAPFRPPSRPGPGRAGAARNGRQAQRQRAQRRYVDSTFHMPAQTAFDQKQMTELFNLGLEQAKNGTAFRTQNPAPTTQTKNKP